ncbi:MAG: hypothetical protein ACW981_00340 [Candidatus Hodarchaeales archaeon]
MNSRLHKHRLLTYFIVISFIVSPFYLSSLASESSDVSFKIVQNETKAGFDARDLNFATYFGPDPDVNNTDFTTFTRTLGENYALEQKIFEFRKTTDTDTYIAIDPQENITREFVIEIRDEVLKNGKGLLFIVDGSNENSTLVVNKFFNDFFDYPIIDVSSSIVTTEGISSTLNYTTVVDFVSPSSPIFNDITKLYYNGSYVTVNSTAIQEFENQEGQIAKIKDYYPLMRSKDKSLGVVFEFSGLTEISNKGRAVIIPSTDLLSNNVVDLEVDLPVKGIQNDQLGLKLVNWISRVSGYFQLDNSSSNVPSGSLIYPDAVIETNFTLSDENGNNFTDAVVKVVLESANQPFITYYAEPAGNGTYASSMKIDSVPVRRSYKINVVVSRRGYLEQSFTLATQIFVSPFLSTWSLPNIMQLLTLLTSLFVYLTTVVFLWRKYRKVNI